MKRETLFNKADALYARCVKTDFSLRQAAPHQRAIARHLMRIIGRAQYELDTCGDEADIAFASAVLDLAEILQETVGLKQRMIYHANHDA